MAPRRMKSPRGRTVVFRSSDFLFSDRDAWGVTAGKATFGGWDDYAVYQSLGEYQVQRDRNISAIWPIDKEAVGV